MSPLGKEVFQSYQTLIWKEKSKRNILLTSPSFSIRSSGKGIISGNELSKSANALSKTENGLSRVVNDRKLPENIMYL
jgi:hypothetical protein